MNRSWRKGHLLVLDLSYLKENWQKHIELALDIIPKGRQWHRFQLGLGSSETLSWKTLFVPFGTDATKHCSLMTVHCPALPSMHPSSRDRTEGRKREWKQGRIWIVRLADLVLLAPEYTCLNFTLHASKCFALSRSTTGPSSRIFSLKGLPRGMQKSTDFYIDVDNPLWDKKHF